MPTPYVPYDPSKDQLLKTHFPSDRDKFTGRFEIALAASGGSATGAYIAGVFDFIWEAFECWKAAIAAGQSAPTHDVRITTLTGTSAGGLTAALAALSGVRTMPHAYEDSLWTAKYGGEVQNKAANPFYRAWVEDITLDLLLSNPKDAETGEFGVFFDAPTVVRGKVFAMIAAAPLASGRSWLSHPLDLRLSIGDLRGVPYALDFVNLPTTTGVLQRLNMHRDHVAFSLGTEDQGGLPTGRGDPPDAYALDPATFPEGGDWPMFGRSAVASAALPLIFRTVQIQQKTAVYDWRGSYWNRATPARAMVDLPAWAEDPRPTDFSYTATDGGVFDNAPFQLAHDRLAGVKGRNPPGKDEACRAVILVAPLVDEMARDPADPRDVDPAKPDRSMLIRTLIALFKSPIEQSRLSTFDLTQIKDETIFSRFMIAPSRPNPTGAKPDWGPSLSLMTAPMSALLGFASKAYREHDFMLGRRNAQNFLRRHFMLPTTHPLVGPNAGWLPADEDIRDGVTYRCIVPLRGRAADEQPVPEWRWNALLKADIARYRQAMGARADALFKNLKKTLDVGGLKGFALEVAWNTFLRGKLLNGFETALAKSRDGLNPVARQPPN